jgi:CheY-like chemotaxis protein
MRYTVALQGFSDFERSALNSFFRLAQQRAPAYERAASPIDSDFIIADADHPADVAAVRDADRMQDTIFIGARASAGASAWLPRPIEPTRIVRELDLLLEQRLALLDEPPQADWVASGPGLLDEAAVAGSGRVVKDVLVVDDSRIALKFLQVRLMRLGYRVHLARNSTQALDRMTVHSFALAFIDIALGADSPMDGLQLCQFMKQTARQSTGGPRIVLITGQAAPAERVRTSLAGSDAYLAKPLMDPEFLATLRELDPDFVAP